MEIELALPFTAMPRRQVALWSCGFCGCLRRQHDDLRCDRRSRIEIDHVMNEEACAGACNAVPDRFGIAGAIDRVKRVHPILIEVEHASTKGIVETARHSASIFSRLRLARDHLLGGRPDRPFGLAPDIRLPAPPK